MGGTEERRVCIIASDKGTENEAWRFGDDYLALETVMFTYVC